MSNTEQPESTVNEYLTKVRDDNGPGVVRPLFEENIKFEFWGQCIDELKDNVMLMAFPFTMKGKSRLWINRLSAGSITTWDLLKNAFLSRYRPLSQIIRQIKAIRNFGQECNEPLHLAWERFNDLLYNSPEHKINEHEQLQIFYQGLDPGTRKKADFMGPIPRMTPAAGIKAIDELSKHSLSWYIEEEYKENDFDKVLKHINDFEHNISVLNEEVRMVQHQYRTPNDKRNSLMEETQLHINIPFIEELEQMPKYAKFMKDLLSKKGKGSEASKIILNKQCSAVVLNKVPPKEKDPGGFTTPYVIGQSGITKALADLGASISLMPYSMFLRLNLGDLKPTRMCIELANKTTQFPKGIAENVMVKFNKFDMEEDHRIPIILGRPFFATAHAMIDVFNKKISFEVGDEIITFDLEKSMRFPSSDEDTCHSADIIDLSVIDNIKEIIPQNHDNSIEPILDQLPAIHEDCNNPALFAANSINEEKPTLKLKELPSHLEYAFLDNNPPEYQEKTTFTCPYGTFAYRRMPFGLCNAPATFQRCMTTIFHDMCKDFMEVFMDDFSVIGNSFGTCLNNLSKMLARCEETNLVLNWEKCHFMVKKGIVLGHKISKAGIEVDKAKVDVIASLPYPTNVNGIRSFLGHVGFYRRFIKDFSKIARPMTQLLMKDAKFDFSDECIKSFNILRDKLITAPVIIAPNWDLDFELMCDASDYAVGAVLGQRIEKKFRTIYYASKTMNNAQEHYTTTEKELLAVEFTIEIKDKKGTENLAVDHLYRLENPGLEELNEDTIQDNFLDEHIMVIKLKNTETDPLMLMSIHEHIKKGLNVGTILKLWIRSFKKGNRIQKLGGNYRDRLDSKSYGNLAESAAVMA
ncbi:reverse transcriptase domain-containing protein [Tanacetum coccineum]